MTLMLISGDITSTFDIFCAFSGFQAFTINMQFRQKNTIIQLNELIIILENFFLKTINVY